MNRRLLVAALLFTLVSCRNEESASNGSEVSKAELTEGYTLQIAFHGLVAYARDGDKVWAFLVDADYEQDPLDDKGLPPAESLPPGVLEEIRAGDLALHEFPLHLARLRIKNATVLSGKVPGEMAGLSISGADLRFQTNVKGLSSVEFSSLSNPSRVSDARGATLGSMRPSDLEQLDPGLLSEKLDKRLAARALIEAGEVEARPVNDCSGSKKFFSYKTVADGDECPGEVEDAVELAEEVVVTQRNVSGPTVIDLGNLDLGRITIQPIDPAEPVVVEILNQTKEAIASTKCLPEDHFGVFRWYYRLLPGAGQSNTGNHLFPCVQRGNFGDPKCPQDLLVIPRMGK